MYKSELFICWQEGLMPRARDVLFGKKKTKKNSPGDVAMALTISGWVNSVRERKNAPSRLRKLDQKQ